MMKLLRLIVILLLLLPVAAHALISIGRIDHVHFIASEEVSSEFYEDIIDHEDAVFPQQISSETEKPSPEYFLFRYRDLYLSNKAESYLSFSKFIVPGLQASELIFPFHFFW